MPESTAIAERSVAMQRSPEFQALRRTFLTFILPMTVLFLAWYLAYVLIASYAPDFFATRLGESYFTIGLLFGLGQFVSTFAITMLYSRWANRVYDRAADPLAAQMERPLDGGER